MMRSIRARLLLGLLLLVVLMSVVAGSITYRRMLAETSNLFDYQLRQMALSMRDQASFMSGFTLPAHSGDADFVIQIWDMFGSRIYFSRPGLPFLNRATLGYSDLTLQGERWRLYAIPTESGVIQVSQPWSVRERYAGAAAVRVLVPLLLLMGVMAVVAAWIVARAMRPLKSITTQIERRDAHSLAPLTAPDLPSEVSPMVRELNSLLERLSGAFASQRAFVADAAHELRSPLTALSLQLQLLERARDDTERALATTRLREAIERATHLVSQLLTLARNEPAGLPHETSSTALESIVRSAAGELQPWAQQRHIDLEIEAPTAITVKADADALRILVRNLIDNAVRYSPEGSRVRVQVSRSAGGQAVLEVADQGPGIAPADRSRAFARFYRASWASEGGSGLGLAIVKAIAERHGAQIALEAAVPHGLRVIVSFPAT